MLLKGPETIIFDNKSPVATMYTLTEEANLVELSDIQRQEEKEHTMVATTKLIADLGNGRPLGGCFTPDNSILYIADAILGLTRIQNPTNPTSKVEIVTTTAMDNENGDAKLTKVNFADDVVVGPVTGNVYFTEASEVLPERNIDTGVWDVMYPSKIELLSGKRSGRLLMYNPTTDETTVLAKGLLFGNGISIDQVNEEYVVFAETYAIRIGKYYLTGDKAGTLEYIVDGSPLPACKISFCLCLCMFCGLFVCWAEKARERGERSWVLHCQIPYSPFFFATFQCFFTFKILMALIVRRRHYLFLVMQVHGIVTLHYRRMLLLRVRFCTKSLIHLICSLEC